MAQAWHGPSERDGNVESTTESNEQTGTREESDAVDRIEGNPDGTTGSADGTTTSSDAGAGTTEDTGASTDHTEGDTDESAVASDEISAEDARALDLDEVFHILQNERRRLVLRYLRDVDGMVEMRDIAVQIAAWENDIDVQQLHSDQRQRVYIALYQSHLPKLDELGVIRYNKPRGYVEPTPLLDDVLEYLEPQMAAADGGSIESDTVERSWQLPYLTATGLATGLVLATWAGIATLSVLSGLGIAIAVVMLFGAITAGHVYSEGLPSMEPQ